MTSVSFFELVLVLVAAAIVLSLAAGRMHLPPAVALVLGGMVLAVLPRVPNFTLDPNLILVLFLPPLLLSSAYETVWGDFREQLRPIMLLSVGAVFFTTALVAVASRLVVPSLPWPTCFALGAIVSPPDAVAAKAVLQRLKLPRRLVTILEGESLVNDASGLVIYKMAVAAALTGHFSATEAGFGFVWLAVAGIGFGILCGLFADAVVRRLRDSRTVIATIFIMSWASYIAAERIEASGVLAVVACGCVMSRKAHESLSAHVRTQANAVWGLAVFILEAVVFVLIGLALRGVLHRGGGAMMTAISYELPLALTVTAVVIVSRFLWVYPAAILPHYLLGRWRPKSSMPSSRALFVISWAGMRGVVTLAAALALPMTFPGRDAVLFVSFTVILFTVLVQGTTLGPLISWLKLQVPPPMMSPEHLDLSAVRIAVHSAALRALEARVVEATGEPVHPRLIENYRRRVHTFERLRDEGEMIQMERHDHFEAALDAVATGRGELIRLHRARKIHETVLRTVESELDLEELRLKRVAGEFAG